MLCYTRPPAPARFFVDIMDRPPPVPPNFICTMHPSEWVEWWQRYPDGTGPVLYNRGPKHGSVPGPFDFSVPPQVFHVCVCTLIYLIHT